jgi:hypothetical protein
MIGNACTGINGESSFEAALLERAPGCEVWGYDFTVNSVRSIPSLGEEPMIYVMACSLDRRLKIRRR